jgi:anti-sigma-K factor RskA
LRDLLPFYILGTLSATEVAEVEAYLRTNVEARKWVEEMSPVAESMVLSSEPVEAAPAIKQKLMERVMADVEKAGIPAGKTGFWERLQQSIPSLSRIRFEPVIVSVSLVVALVALAWALSTSREISELRQEVVDLQASVTNQEQIILYLSDPASRSVVIAGTEHRPEAQANMIYSPEGNEGGLLITGLAPLAANQVYQLWLIEGETPQSAGTFTVDDNGQASVLVAAQGAISGFDAVGVSVEPVGGSLQPTGDIVLLGSLSEDA